MTLIITNIYFLDINAVIEGTVGSILLTMITYTVCCIICCVFSNKKKSDTSGRPVILLTRISGSQGQFTTQQHNASSASEKGEVGLRSGEPPQYNELYKTSVVLV